LPFAPRIARGSYQLLDLAVGKRTSALVHQRGGCRSPRRPAVTGGRGERTAWVRPI